MLRTKRKILCNHKSWIFNACQKLEGVIKERARILLMNDKQNDDCIIFYANRTTTVIS